MNSTVPAILGELAVAGIPIVLAANVERDTVPADVHLVRGDPTQPATISSTKLFYVVEK
jgi:hypothetical protein